MSSSPVTKLHYTANGNFDHGSYSAAGDPGSDGFNVADVSSVSAADALPTGDQGLIYWGQTTGVTAAFKAMVTAAHADPHVLGFYIADEPSDDAATLANIKAEVQYINAHDGGKIAFIVAENDSSPENPVYGVTPANTGMTAANDLIGLDPYPVRPEFSGGINLSVIDAAVSAAEKAGWSLSQIVPVYQTFGGGGYSDWTLPTATQEKGILAEWGKVTPNPRFDYAYSWGTQSGDSALSNTPALQQVLAAHNSGQL